MGSPSRVLLLLRGPLSPLAGGGSAPLGAEAWVQARRAPTLREHREGGQCAII